MRTTTLRAPLAACTTIGLLAGVVTLGLAGPAAADTSPRTYASPGTYTIDVPADAGSITIRGVGGAGDSGQPGTGGSGSGGHGGLGESIEATLPVGPGHTVQPGDVLAVGVGEQGAGGRAGSGNTDLGGKGGNGGSASWVVAPGRKLVLVAGGGGGGGGGAGSGTLFAGYWSSGANGGEAGDGDTTQRNGSLGGLGGDYGGTARICPTPTLTSGASGGTVTTSGDSSGGGGGGGGGACGGAGGQSGDQHGYLLGLGGAGGGSGGSMAADDATSRTYWKSAGSGLVVISFGLRAHHPVSTTAVDFGSEHLGQRSASRDIAVSNNGDVPMSVHGMGLVGSDPGDFIGGPGDCARELAPHESCHVTITFAPAQAGIRSATLVFDDTAFDGAQRVELTGVGVADPATATLSSTTVQYADQPVGTSSPDGLVTVTNDGGVPLTLDGLSMSGPDAGDFSGTFGDCPVSLDPGSSCRLGATFSPSASGPRTATLHLSTNAPSSPPIDLRGTGTQAQPTAPSAPTIASVKAGNGSATISFVPPTDNGGAAITSYRVTSQSGSHTVTGASSPLTVTGLTNGTAYSFTVTATNRAGTSVASAPSARVVPLRPLSVTTAAALSNGKVRVSYRKALTSSGGVGAVSWSLASGSRLPTGLRLSSAGVLSGTPTAASTYRFSVRVTDSAKPARSTTKALRLTVTR